MNRLIIIVLLAVLSGCSVFRSSLTEQDTTVEKIHAKDIVTEIIENIRVDIPVDAIDSYRKRVDTTGNNTGKKVDKNINKPPSDKKITVTINRKTNRTNKSTVSTDSASHTKTKEKLKKKPQLISFTNGILLGIIGIAALLIFLKIKFF